MNIFSRWNFNSLKQSTKVSCWVTVLLKIVPPKFIVLLNTCFSIPVTIWTRVDQSVGVFTCWVPVSVFLVKELTIYLLNSRFSQVSEKCLLTAYSSCQLIKCLAECPFQHAKRIFLYFCLAECPFQSRSFKRSACRQHISVAWSVMSCWIPVSADIVHLSLYWGSSNNPRLCLKVMNLFSWRGFVKMSASWSSVPTLSNSMWPLSTWSLMKWCLTSMCFVLECRIGLCVIAIALVLSQKMGVFFS